MSSGVLLCRGNSLNRILELYSIDVDCCYIVNEWKAELENPEISNFLVDKDIVHYLNRESFSLLPPTPCFPKR